MTVKFEKAETKGTKVTLIHEGFPDKDEQFYSHETGWDLLIGESLKAYLEMTPTDYTSWWKKQEPIWQQKWQKMTEEKMKPVF